MKVPNNSEIKSAVKFVAKRVKTGVASTTEHSENPEAVKNSLNALASSSIAHIKLQSVTRESVLSRFSDIIDKFQYAKPLRKYISECENGSKELLDIETLLAHCKPNKNGLNLFDPKMFNFIRQDRKIPEAISRDLEILRKPGNLIDNYVPTFATKEEALANSKTGDVFQIKGQKGVSIRNKSDEIEELSMDRDSYFKLFPPVQRFANIQPDFFGICYEVTALNAAMENPATRENILRCIDTMSEKGQIKIKFPKSNFEQGIKFKDSDVLSHGGPDLYASGCTGIKYIEYALGKEYEKDFVDFEVKKMLEKGNKEAADAIQSMYKKNQLEKLAEYCGSDRKCTLGERLREAGDAIVPWNILGLEENGSIEMERFTRGSGRGKQLIDDYRWADKYKHGKIITDEEKYAEALWSPEFFENHLVEAYVGDSGSESALSHWHSYRLLPVIDDAGKIDSYLIKDPHGIVDRQLSFDEVFTEIDSISFAKIK